MKNPTQWANDQLAIRAAEAKAVESQLPGRRAGPADAYRHLIWAAELTRRFGEERARAILEAHEIQGSNSVDKEGNAQSPDEAEMDRHNNEIGIGLGKNAKTFDEVVSGAQRTIEESRNGDSPNGKGATWLDRAQWQKNPKDGQGKELPEDGWNWGDGFDWAGKTIKEPYEYPYGGEEHKQQPSELKFPETDGVIDSLKPSPSSQTPESQESPVSGEQSGTMENAPEQKQSEAPADPRAASLVEMASAPIDTPGKAALLKPVEKWTQPEMMAAIDHAQGDYRGFRSGDPLKAHTYEKVQDWHVAMYGDAPQANDGGKPIEPQPIRPIPEQASPHTTPDGRDLWQATAKIGQQVVDAAGTDGYDNAVKGLQRGLNILNASNPLPGRSPAYGPYTKLGPVIEDGQYGPQTDFALKHATARLGPAKVQDGLALGRFNTFARQAQSSGNADGLEAATHGSFGPLFRDKGDDKSPKMEGGVLQETLNAIGPQHHDDWENLKVDNWVGPKTTAAFGRVLQNEDADRLTTVFGRGLGLL